MMYSICFAERKKQYSFFIIYYTVCSSKRYNLFGYTQLLQQKIFICCEMFFSLDFFTFEGASAYSGKYQEENMLSENFISKHIRQSFNL